MTTLENKFPLLAVEHGCIISKDADITVAFEVELPELYTVTGAEYEATALFSVTMGKFRYNDILIFYLAPYDFVNLIHKFTLPFK